MRAHFEWRYLVGRTPWDSGVVPPEVISYLDSHPPGRALDLGCGTGTNTIAMTRRGWRVTAFDFSTIAVARARAKIARAALRARVRRQDLTNVNLPPDTFDLVLDIGCFHALEPHYRARYGSQVAGCLVKGASYLLYSFLGPPVGEERWPPEDETRSIFSKDLALEQVEYGDFHRRPSAWFHWIRKSR